MQYLKHMVEDDVLFTKVISKFKPVTLTRKHSSRMHTASLTTIYVWWLLLGVSTVCPQVNKFEQVSSDDSNVCSGGVSQVPCPGEGEEVSSVPCLGREFTLPCDLFHDACDASYQSPLVNRQIPVKTLPSQNYCCSWQKQVILFIS